MTNLLFGMGRRPVSDSEGHVRSTVDVVDKTEPAAVAPTAPDYNEPVSDPYTAGGLTTHTVASRVVPSDQYVPEGDGGDAVLEGVTAVDDQVSSSGTAAMRERAGRWGHGTMQVVEGIEPTVRDGGRMGNEYFDAGERPLSGSGNELSPAHAADPATSSAAQSAGEDASRDAVAASQSPYAMMYAAMMGGR